MDQVNDKTFFSNNGTFDSLPLSQTVKKSLQEMNFTRLTRIQAKAIPLILNGFDVLGTAQTGSGKTLSFLVPIVHLLQEAKYSHRNGTGAIIISPTRELALQIYDVLNDISKYNSQTHGLIIGGANRNNEVEKLLKGINIIVCTPGRLLDHLQSTKGFKIDNLGFLVIDEADKILQIGFEEDISAILKILPSKRQTILFSATLNPKVADLAKLSLKNPAFVKVESPTPTVTGLEQGTLLCTDVAARGLDIPKVDIIVQYDPPSDPKEYIHRVGRTGRGENGKGQALLFLMPEELSFLNFLKEENVSVEEYKFDESKIANSQSELETLVEKNYYLHQSSREAYKSYIHAYQSHSHKDIFNVNNLDLSQVAASFGFKNPPKIEFSLKPVLKKKKNILTTKRFRKK